MGIVRNAFSSKSSGRLLVLGLSCIGCAIGNDARDPVNVAGGGLAGSGVSFQAVMGGQFFSAVNNGGGAVNATAAVVQDWERFSLTDVNGGTLESGDSVFIQAGNGQFFQAVNGGGSTLNAASANQLGWETFRIVKQAGGGGTISNGDVVGLQAMGGSWVSAQNGGGGPVFAYGGALGSWEQLTISGLTPTPAPTPPLPPPPPTPTPTPTPGPGTPVAGVSFRTQVGGTFIGAQNNGGGAVTVSALSAQTWEMFTLMDLNGGSLDSGDAVLVKTGGGQFFRAANGGGSTLDATAADQASATAFKIIKQSGGGAVKTGDIVGLQTSAGNWVSAENGGGGNVFAYGGALGAWEAFAVGIGAPAGGNPTSPPGWRLVWSDEFNGNGIDWSKWSAETHPPGWVNHEWQGYTARPENVRVENGHLVIEGRHDFAGGGEYSSGKVNSAGHASWTYGRMEARIQLPGGRGTWPAFWMMPNDFSRGWPACGEIDIMEEVGFNQDTIVGTTHSGRYNWPAGTQRTASIGVGGVTTGYHVYAIEWSPGGIDYFVDDRKYFTSPNDNTDDDAWPFHKDFYVILNLAIGGDWGGAQGVEPNIWPRQMLVDYVRVYQR